MDTLMRTHDPCCVPRPQFTGLTEAEVIAALGDPFRPVDTKRTYANFFESATRTALTNSSVCLLNDKLPYFPGSFDVKLCNLSERRFFRNLRVMRVHFTPEQEAQLAQIASKEGTDAERLVKDAVLRLLEEDARFRAAVREGIAQADRGEFIEEAEMDARLEQMLRS
jgi:predicted transcriptional regulator